MPSDRARRPPPATTILAAALAMGAFTANGLLCRGALGPDAIDPASFTTLRLTSGALMLFLLAALPRREEAPARGGGKAGILLFVYAVTFSFAYAHVEAGAGALLLFGAVQVTMIISGLRQGERLRAPQWCGLLLAFGGVTWLVAPGVSAPPLLGSALMVLSGAAWGGYCLLGRDTRAPQRETMRAFLFAVPPAALISLLFLGDLHLTPRGVGFAVASGALGSGLAYVVWYVALRGLTTTRAASLQLLVPVLTAAGGVLLLGEEATPRLAIATVLVLTGVWLACRALAASADDTR
jgi:drug/metabolite transporter (DMT)-like permease